MEPALVICSCLTHSLPKTEQFIGQDSNNFIGRFVLLGFPTLSGNKESLWVYTVRLGIHDTQLEGILYDNPMMNTEYHCGDSIAFDVREIIGDSWRLYSR